MQSSLWHAHTCGLDVRSAMPVQNRHRDRVFRHACGHVLRHVLGHLVKHAHSRSPTPISVFRGVYARVCQHACIHAPARLCANSAKLTMARLYARPRRAIGDVRSKIGIEVEGTPCLSQWLVQPRPAPPTASTTTSPSATPSARAVSPARHRPTRPPSARPSARPTSLARGRRRPIPPPWPSQPPPSPPPRRRNHLADAALRHALRHACRHACRLE